MRRERPSGPGAVAAALCFGLPVAYSSAVSAPFWSPKAALLLVAGATGLSMLRALLATERRAATSAAIAFLGVAGAATVLSPAPLASTVGLYGSGTGLVFLAACVGSWALGASTAPRDQAVMMAALVAGIGVSAVVGALQTLDLVEVTSLRAAGRASGLAGNPVFLGSLAVAVVAVAARLAPRHRGWLVALAGAAFVVQLSGTRSAHLVAVVIALTGAVRARGKAAVLMLLALVAGIAAGSILTASRDLSSASASGRATTAGVVAGDTTQVRLEVWRSSRHAIARRPVLGHGPGRYRAATAADRTLREAQLEGADVLYQDGHNLIVEELVTTGFLGAAALVVWLGLAFRRARGPLAWCAGALAILSLVQPLEAGVTPVLFLSLGAAASVGPRRLRWPTIPAVAIAALLAVVLLVGDNRLHHAFRDREITAARLAVRLSPGSWPQASTVLARIHSERGRDDRARVWLLDAHRRDPSDSYPLLVLGGLARGVGDFDEAEKRYVDALERNPWSRYALRGLALVAEERGELDAARSYAERALEVEPDPELDALLRRLDTRRMPVRGPT